MANLTPPKKKVSLPEPARPLTMNFPDAIRQVINGKRVARVSWGDAGDYGLLKDGWLTIFTRNDFHVWKVNDGDLQGEDWVVIPEAD